MQFILIVMKSLSFVNLKQLLKSLWVERTHKLISNQRRGATSASAANDFTKISTPSSLSRAKRSGCLNFTTRGLPLTYQTSKYTDVSRTDVCLCT